MPVLTFDEIETLVLAVSFDREVTDFEIGRTLMDGAATVSEAADHGRRRLIPLLKAKAMWRATSGHFFVTEKGRIAATLCIAKNPALGPAYFDDWDRNENTVTSLSRK